MFTGITKARARAVFLFGFLAAAGGLWATGAAGGQPPVAKAPDSGAAKAGEQAAPFEVRGKVLGPDGKPAAGAEVFVCDRLSLGKDLPKDKDEKSLVARATTDAQGVYTIKTTKAEMGRNPTVVAVAKDLGPDWVPLTRANRGGGLPDLRLVKDDVPVSGRVLDLESQPVAGATVRVLRVLKAPGENLWPFFGAWNREHPTTDGRAHKFRPVGYEEGAMTDLDVSRELKTGADGRFELSGFGRDRLVVLAVEGPDLARRVVEVVTRAALPKGVPIFAAKADYLLAPAKSIVGTVREKGSGNPVAGVEVTCGSHESLEPVRATTDAEGRYRLAGVAKAKGYYPVVQGGPYIQSAHDVGDTPGLDAITADFEVERGLEVRGRLIDKTTGRPVRGYVEYHARNDNPHLKDFPGFTRAAAVSGGDQVRTGRDGAFSLAVPPGRGLIVARSWENRFTNAWSSPDLSAVTEVTPAGRRAVGVIPSVGNPESFHAAVAIEASEKDSKSLVYEIALDPGLTLTGTVVGPDGKPLTGTLAWGLRPALHAGYDVDLSLLPLRTPAFVASGLDDRNPRYLLFWHKERGLAKAILVWGDEPGPLPVRLEPLGTVTGRLVDQGGQPLAGVEVSTRFIADPNGHARRLFLGGFGLPIELVALNEKTDAEGRFRSPLLVPGLTYDLSGIAPNGNENGQYFPGFVKDVPAPTGGEPKNLGTITLTVKKPEPKKP